MHDMEGSGWGVPVSRGSGFRSSQRKDAFVLNWFKKCGSKDAYVRIMRLGLARCSVSGNSMPTKAGCRRGKLYPYLSHPPNPGDC